MPISAEGLDGRWPFLLDESQQIMGYSIQPFFVKSRSGDRATNKCDLGRFPPFIKYNHQTKRSSIITIIITNLAVELWASPSAALRRIGAVCRVHEGLHWRTAPAKSTDVSHRPRSSFPDSGETLLRLGYQRLEKSHPPKSDHWPIDRCSTESMRRRFFFSRLVAHSLSLPIF